MVKAVPPLLCQRVQRALCQCDTHAYDPGFLFSLTSTSVSGLGRSFANHPDRMFLLPYIECSIIPRLVPSPFYPSWPTRPWLGLRTILPLL